MMPRRKQRALGPPISGRLKVWLVLKVILPPTLRGNYSLVVLSGLGRRRRVVFPDYLWIRGESEGITVVEGAASALGDEAEALLRRTIYIEAPARAQLRRCASR